MELLIALLISNQLTFISLNTICVNLNDMSMTVKIINKSNNPNPEYKTSGSSGMDVRAFMSSPLESKA